MHLFVLLLFYLWISLIHATFSGICLYAFWGHKLLNKRRVLPVLILTVFLGFLETYWIPIALYLGLSIQCGQQDIRDFLKIGPEENIVRSLFPTALSIIIWVIQAIIADFIGRSVYLRLIRKLTNEPGH
jgi:hypothetical protein